MIDLGLDGRKIEPISFAVLGLPATQGNKTGRPFRRSNGTLGVVMTEGKTKAAAEHLHSWRGMIANAASIAMQRRKLVRIEGPVVVVVTFYMPRPANALKRLFPDTRPDLDKLQRAVGDALSGVAYVDDSRIVDWHPKKRFADTWAHNTPGASIVVRPATEEDL